MLRKNSFNLLIRGAMAQIITLKKLQYPLPRASIS